MKLCAKVYVRGSAQAVEHYKRAFHAALGAYEHNDDGSFSSADVNVDGQTLFTLSESAVFTKVGDKMQFLIRFGNEEEIQRAYAVLKEECISCSPLEPAPWSPLCADVIDRFGIRWGLII